MHERPEENTKQKSSLELRYEALQDHFRRLDPATLERFVGDELRSGESDAWPVMSGGITPADVKRAAAEVLKARKDQEGGE